MTGFYTELRARATAVPSERKVSPSAELNEAIQEFINEAYYGKNQVQKIRDAVSKLRDAYLENPNRIYTWDAANRELQNTICEAFGFKRCSIYWTNQSDIQMGPGTIPKAQIFTTKGPYIVVGSNPNGYYDTDHKLICMIMCDLCLFTDRVGLTADEMTAILLHEIGHNFDYTIGGIIKSYTVIINAMLAALATAGTGPTLAHQQSFAQLLALSIKEFCPEAITYTVNAEDLLMNIIPPIGRLCRAVGRAVQPFMRLLSTIFKAASWFAVPLHILTSPIRQLSSYLVRKGEIYADSFVAAYGFGPELQSALAKLDMFQEQTTIKMGPVTGLLNDLSLLQYELLTTVANGHGSAQQRSLRMLDSLNKSLVQSDLSNEDKALIIEERDRLMDAYQKYISLDDTKKDAITHSFRNMIDSWYNGKPYIFPSIDLGQGYAG